MPADSKRVIKTINMINVRSVSGKSATTRKPQAKKSAKTAGLQRSTKTNRIV